PVRARTRHFAPGTSCANRRPRATRRPPPTTTSTATSAICRRTSSRRTRFCVPARSRTPAAALAASPAGSPEAPATVLTWGRCPLSSGWSDMTQGRDGGQPKKQIGKILLQQRALRPDQLERALSERGSHRLASRLAQEG